MTIRRKFSVVSDSCPVPNVAVVTPTRRWGDPGSDAYKARYHGLVALYDQFSTQKYPPGALELRIADTSPEPHPFFQELRDPRVIYLHMPERSQALRDQIEAEYPGAGRFILLDADLETDDMRYRIERLQSYCSRKTCYETGRQKPSIQDPLEISFPTIGMQRNVLCSLPFRGTGTPDIVVSFDDDDWRSPDYVANRVKSLQGNNGWTKLVNYHLAILGADGRINWAKKYLESSQDKDQDGLPVGLKTSKPHAMMFVAASGFSRADPESAFNPQRWHSLSTDGAVHAFRHKDWERAVDLFGGYLPVSYNEDVLLFEAFRMLGRMEAGRDIARSPAIYEALKGLREYSSEDLASDKQRGMVGIKPDFSMRGDFCRLCCGNVSPVVFTDMVRDGDIRSDMKRGFSRLQAGIREEAPVCEQGNPERFDLRI